MTKKNHTALPNLLLLAAMFLLCLSWVWQLNSAAPKTTYSQVRQLILQEKVKTLTVQDYTLTLELGEDSEPVTLEAEQGKSLRELNVEAPERENMQFDGWYTEDGTLLTDLRATQDLTVTARWESDDAWV